MLSKNISKQKPVYKIYRVNVAFVTKHFCLNTEKMPADNTSKYKCIITGESQATFEGKPSNLCNNNACLIIGFVTIHAHVLF